MSRDRVGFVIPDLETEETRDLASTEALFASRSKPRYGLSVSRIQPSAIRDVYIFVWRDEKLLLLLRDGTGYKDGAWGPPAGKVEPGETYLEAAVRELREETGLDASPSTLRLVHLLDRTPEVGERWPWVGAFFEVNDLDGEPVNREPAKCRAIAWHPPYALPDPIVDYVGHVLSAVADGVTYSEWRASEQS